MSNTDPFLICTDCRRKSQASKSGDKCNMTQPNGSRCHGTFKSLQYELVTFRHCRNCYHWEQQHGPACCSAMVDERPLSTGGDTLTPCGCKAYT